MRKEISAANTALRSKANLYVWRASFDRSILNYCDKNLPETQNIPIKSLCMNPDLNALLTYKLTLERRVVLAAEIS